MAGYRTDKLPVHSWFFGEKTISAHFVEVSNYTLEDNMCDKSCCLLLITRGGLGCFVSYSQRDLPQLHCIMFDLANEKFLITNTKSKLLLLTLVQIQIIKTLGETAGLLTSTVLPMHSPLSQSIGPYISNHCFLSTLSCCLWVKLEFQIAKPTAIYLYSEHWVSPIGLQSQATGEASY